MKYASLFFLVLVFFFFFFFLSCKPPERGRYAGCVTYGTWSGVMWKLFRFFFVFCFSNLTEKGSSDMAGTWSGVMWGVFRFSFLV